MSPHSAERYTAPIPEAWPGLLVCAQNILDQEADPDAISKEGALALCKQIALLDTEQLDTTMYYGQGLLMCEFAQLLQEPDARATLVHDIAKKQLEHHLANHPTKPPRIHSFEEAIAETELEKTATQAAAALEPDVRLLVNALSAMSIDRRFVATFPRVKGEAPITAFYLYGLRQGTVAPRHLAANATTGARRILLQTLKHGAGLASSAPLKAAVISGVLSRPEACRKAAVGGAQVRLDEINDLELFDSLFSADATGGLVFDREHLRTPPPPPKPPDPTMDSLPVLRHERLSCPAIRVPGLITMALGLVASIMVETQNLYETREQAQRSSHLFALANAA